MEKFVITINRQFGSMGRPIAKEMAQQLNVEFYDRDLIEKAAEKLGLPLSKASDLEETAAKERFFDMCFPLGHGSENLQNEIFNVQRQTILDLADGQSCIIVGRCSDYILQSVKNVVRIYIYAPYRARLDNCVNKLLIPRDRAEKMIRHVDKARDAYQMKYAHYHQGDFNHYDILIDSSLLGVEGTARYLTELILCKFASPQIEEDL